MKVKIIKSKYPTYWYNHFIGCVYEVNQSKKLSEDLIENCEKECYRIKEDNNPNNSRLIDVEDCEIIS